MITLRHRKSGPALAVLLGVVLACLVGASTASAGNGLSCWGRTVPTTANQQELTYVFRCSDEIKNFSLVSNLEVGEFSTTADVFDPTTMEPVSGQTFGCEGPIPGNGFGCTGNANMNLVTGTFGLDEARCVKRRNKLRVWIVATDATGASTGPFGLGVPPRCPKKASGTKHTAKRA